MAARLFSFPNPVNEVAARLVAGGVVVLSAAELATGQRWLLIPLVGLTTAATVIASQAVISGAFTLVQQAIQLGAVPRLEVRQTSDESAGQVYVPQINWLLVASVLGRRTPEPGRQCR